MSAGDDLARAIERDYLRLVTGTLRRKRVAPERMAVILVAIAERLLAGVKLKESRREDS